MIDGILLINKEEEITSYDVIRRLKRLLPKGLKIGHAGTLDPFATGLLVVLLGRGTKLMEKFHTLDKEYLVEGEFGYSTDTQDVTGNVLKRCEHLSVISKDEIMKAIEENLLGKFTQTPPMYSAKKVNGKKAYDLAREGVVVELKGKEIEVKSFEIIEYNWPRVKFRILCSTGTYIRTLINDLGDILGCGATAVTLCRERIGDFSLHLSVDSALLESEDFVEKIITLENIKL